MTLYGICHTCRHQHALGDAPEQAFNAWRDWQFKHAGHDVDLRSQRAPTFRPLRRILSWFYQHNANIKIAYAGSSNLTVTNLNSLAASSTHSSGWESGAIDNTTDLYEDYFVSAKITVGTTLTAGQIRLHIVGMLDDSTWPDVFDGTESAETPTDTEMRDAICKLGAVTETDTTNSDVYYLGPFSVAALFSGICPAKFVIFITQSTNANLASSGNQVTIKGVYRTATG